MNGKELGQLITCLIEGRIDDKLIKELKTLAQNRADKALCEEDVEKIKTVFLERENLIKNTDRDYTCCSNDFNLAWVALAESLCSETDLFQCHHYQLLYSKVSNLDDLEVIQRRPLKLLPLNTLMVSDNHKFMSWESAMENATYNNGVLAIYEEMSKDHKVRWHKFTINEEKYFQQNHPDEWQKLLDIRNQKGNNDNGQRLTKSTVHALIRLVECCTFKSGAISSYSESEQNYAYKAYGEFKCYLNLLCEEEKQCLMEQIIESKGRTQTFQYLWDLLIRDKMCVHWANSQICRLILDYMPNYEFKSKPLVDLVGDKDFGHESKNKDYALRCPFKSIEQMIAMSMIVLEQLNMQRNELIERYYDELLTIASDSDNAVAPDRLDRCYLVTNSILDLFQKKLSVHLKVNPTSLFEDGCVTFKEQALLSLKLSSLNDASSNKLIYKVFMDKLFSALCDRAENHHFFIEKKDKNGKDVSQLISKCSSYIASISQLETRQVFLNTFTFIVNEEQYSFLELSLSKAKALLEKYSCVLEVANNSPSV